MKLARKSPERFRRTAELDFHLETDTISTARPTTDAATGANLSCVTFQNSKERAVKLTVARTIPFTLAVAIAALAVSGIGRFKDAKHGVDLVVGDIAWFGFLIAALTTLVLTGIAVYRRRRRDSASAAHA